METLPKNLNEQEKVTKSTFHSHFHSFASILDLWKVVDIKSKKKQIEQKRATKYSKKLRRATKSKNGHRSWKKPKRATKGKWKPGLSELPETFVLSFLTEAADIPENPALQIRLGLASFRLGKVHVLRRSYTHSLGTPVPNFYKTSLGVVKRPSLN